MEIIKAISRILAYPFVLLVLLYQKILSPDHGLLKPWYPYGYCKFYPSCSEYTVQVLRKDGILGIVKIIKRLISCRPGVAPAIDKP
jgi:putative component of membrane protein insertase Oxa1/YidC/SpoIIIJ protein YidD